MYTYIFLRSTEENAFSDADSPEYGALLKQFGLSGQDKIAKQAEQDFREADSITMRVIEQLFPVVVEMKDYDRDRIPLSILTALNSVAIIFPHRKIHSGEIGSVLLASTCANSWETGYKRVLIGMWGKGKKPPTWEELEAKARAEWLAATAAGIEKGLAELKCCQSTMENMCNEVFKNGKCAEITVRTWL